MNPQFREIVASFFSILNAYLESINQTGLLYFFSTLAQCAAAFAALVGVFAIFRLQANTSRIGEEYIAARYWLRTSLGLGNADVIPCVEIKKWLEKIRNKKEWQKEHSQSADEVLKRILDAEAFNQKLVYKVSKPLKWWAYIFYFR